MTHYAVSQIVELIQENLHEPGYYDVHKYAIESKLRKLIQQENPRRYSPVTKLSKYSLDEQFKNKALRLLTDFERERIPTPKETLIADLESERIEDESAWFKLSKLYHALKSQNAIPEGVSDRRFWTQAHKVLKTFESIYIKTINPYSKYPNVAIVHYRIDDLEAILKQLVGANIIQQTPFINEL